MMEIKILETAVLLLVQSKKVISVQVAPHLQKILAVKFVVIVSELGQLAAMMATLSIRMGK